MIERRQAEATLRESDDRLSAITDCAKDGIIMLDTDGNVCFWNPAAEKLIGYSADEIMGRNFHDLIVPSRFHTEHRSAFASWQETGQGDAIGKTLELSAIRKDGVEVPVELSLSSSILSDRQFAIGIVRDITERKLAQENKEKMLLRLRGVSQLRQSLLAPAPLEDRLRKVTDTIVRLFDADFCRIWLIRPGDLCEQGCIHAEVQDGPHACRRRDRCLHLLTSSGRYTHIDGQGHRRVPFGCYKIGRVASGEEHKFVTNDTRNDPRIHDHAWVRDLGLVSFAGYQLRAPGGETLGVLALFAKHPISVDEDAILDGLGSTVALVVKQAVAEESLLRSETKFRTLYDSNSDAVMLADEHGFLDCNGATLAIFGCSTREEFCSKHPADVSPPQQPDGTDSLTLANQRIAAAMEKGSDHFEWIHKRVDTGEPFHADVLLNAMELDGKPIVQAVVRNITERKQAEEALKIFKESLDNSTDAIGMATPQGTHYYQNRAFDRLFGPAGERPLDTVYVDKKVGEEVFGTIMSGGNWTGEVKMYARDRQILDILLRAYANKDANGNLTSLVGIHTDITDRKLAEDEIRRVNAAISATGDAIAMATADGYHFYQNEAFGRLFGYTLEEVARLQPAGLFACEDDAKKIFGPIVAGESWSGETEMVAKNGRHIPVSLRADAIKDDLGNVTGLVGVFTDITGRKEVEEKLKLFSNAVEGAHDGVLMVNLHGGISYANASLMRNFGYTLEEFVSMPITSLSQNPEDAKSILEGIREKGVWIGEVLSTKKDGTTFLAALSASLVKTKEGKPLGTMGILSDITDRKRAEDELRKLSQAVEQSPTSVVITDVHGSIEYVNPKFCGLTGYTSAEAIGQNPRILNSGLTPKETYDQMWSTIGAGQIWTGEFLNRKKTGELFWERANIFAIKDATGTITHYIALKEDITEQKRIEEERSRFIAVIDGVPESIAILNADGSIMYVNHTFEKNSGVASGRAVGHNYEAMTRKLYAYGDYGIPWDRIQAGESWTDSITYERSDGKLHLLDQSVSPIRSQSGEIINYVVFSRDVTEERELGIRARWADERLRLSIDGMVDGLTLWDVRMAPDDSIQEFVCLEANPAALRMLGKERQATLGLSVQELMTGQKDYDLHDLFRQVLDKGQPAIIEHVHILRGQDKVVLTINVWAVGAGVACLMHDVTQRLDLETQLRQAQKLEAVGSLAAGIAHEINTPIQFVGDNIRFLADSFSGLMKVLEHHRECREKMASLLGEHEELQQLRDLDSEVDVDYLKTEIPLAVEQSLEGVSRVSTIVRAMKDFSHVDEREMVMADINQMLDTTLTVARNELKYVADVVKDLAPDLPAAECFRNDLNQVFLNLLVNAAHAIGEVVSAEGQDRGTITVATRRDGDEIVVSISDTGGGIPEGIRDRIFDHFFTTKEVGKGTGQGLSIARSIVVEKHKGAITFDSEIGKGTTFYIRLPITRKEVEHAESQHPVRG